MGPFTNNTPPPAPNRGNKLPVPDVEGAPQHVVISTSPDSSLATKKWLITTLVITAAMAATGLVIFIVYAVISNTPGYMLSAAMQNLASSDGEAGIIRYETKQGQAATSTQGNFLAYTDPTDPNTRTLTLSVGQGGARLSGTLRLFADGNYAQAAGFGNLGRFIDSLRGNSSSLTADKLLRLSSLDGQWYTFTPDDVFDLRQTLPRQIQGGPTATDIATIEQLYLDHPFLVAAQQLSDEKIEGVNTMHIRASFDQAKLAEFLQALKSANIKWLTLSDDDIKALQSGQLFGLSEANLEVWIARSDRTFQQIRLNRPASSDTITLTFKSEQAAAQRQTVIRPEGAKSITSLVRGIQGILASPTAPPPAQQ